MKNLIKILKGWIYLYTLNLKMKKTLLFFALVFTLFLLWCSKWWSKDQSSIFYDKNLIIEGIVDENFHVWDIAEWTLILKWKFEDHTDHILLAKWEREDFLNNKNESLPWNTVQFMGTINEIDAAAWNHYYKIDEIDKLLLKSYPDQEQINEIINWYNFCDVASDCYNLWIWYEFWCYNLINKTYKDIMENIVNNYLNINWKIWNSECKFRGTIECEENKCISSNEKPAIVCSDEDRSVENCNPDFNPVCWDNGFWYNNWCFACKSKDVSSYTQWWCENISYFINWKPKNLDYITDFIKENWTATCNMKYDFNWETLWWNIIISNDKFYWTIDMYFDWKIYHDYTILSVDWNRYEWMDEIPTLRNKYTFVYPIESEIQSLLETTEIFNNFEVDCNSWVIDDNVFVVPDIEFF